MVKTESEIKEEFDNQLDEDYLVKIADFTFYASEVWEQQDPIGYNCALLHYSESLENEED